MKDELLKITFYEHQGPLIDWKTYFLDPSATQNLSNYETYRRGQFIYFMDSNNYLMRIDTKEKKLEGILSNQQYDDFKKLINPYL